IGQEDIVMRRHRYLPDPAHRHVLPELRAIRRRGPFHLIEVIANDLQPIHAEIGTPVDHRLQRWQMIPLRSTPETVKRIGRDGELDRADHETNSSAYEHCDRVTCASHHRIAESSTAPSPQIA